MSIRKTGAATGNVTEVEGQGIAKTAQQDPGWRPEDEELLEAEDAS